MKPLNEASSHVTTGGCLPATGGGATVGDPKDLILGLWSGETGQESRWFGDTFPPPQSVYK